MKIIVMVLVPLVTLGLCVWGDIALVRFLFTQLPQDLSWLFWAKVGIVFADIWLTAGIVIWLTSLSAAIIAILIDD